MVIFNSYVKLQEGNPGLEFHNGEVCRLQSGTGPSFADLSQARGQVSGSGPLAWLRETMERGPNL
jgi:hypothetical protein